VLYEKDSCRIVEHRCGKEDMDEISNWWMETSGAGFMNFTRSGATGSMPS